MPGLNVALPKPTILQPSEEEKQLVQGFKSETQTLESRVEPLQQERRQLEGEMRQVTQTMPSPPQLAPMPEFRPRQLDAGEMMTFAGIATALAALGAKAVKGDITMALGAAGSAIKGFNEGNITQTKLDIANFNTTMKAVVAQNNEILNSYKAVLEDRKLTLSQKMQQYQVLATKYQDEVAMSALRKGDLRVALDLEKSLRTANQQIETMWTRMQGSFAAQEARMEAAAELARARDASRNPNAGQTQYSPEAVDMLARAAIKDKNSLANIGRGIQGARDLAAINNRLAEILATEGGPDLAAQRAEYRANANSLNKMVAQYDAITSFEKNALANGKVLVDLAERVDITGMPVLERWIRGGRKSIAGDPDVSQFHTQLVLFRAEAARILTNPNLSGTLTVHAQQEAESFINGNDSAEQIGKVVRLLESDFKRREVTLVDQMNAARDRMSRSAGAGGPGGQGMQSFGSEADARAAGKKNGDRVIINGVAGTLE